MSDLVSAHSPVRLILMNRLIFNHIEIEIGLPDH